jgi:hypothetical protein
MDGDVKTRLPLLCGLTKSGVDGTASTPASIPLTSYDVKDFSLWIPTYVSTIPVSLNLTLPYVETQTYTYQYSASVQIQSPTPSVSTLLLSFKKDASEVSYVDNHQFDGVFGTASIQLKSLQVIFAGNSYPKAAPYDFTPFTGDLDYCKDMENAYMAYRTFSLSKEAASTSMTFTQWLMAPVFVFSLLPISPSQDRTIQINTSTTGNTALCKMHVTFLYPRELKLSYDENAMLLPVEVSDEV